MNPMPVEPLAWSSRGDPVAVTYVRISTGFPCCGPPRGSHAIASSTIKRNLTYSYLVAVGIQRN